LEQQLQTEAKKRSNEEEELKRNVQEERKQSEAEAQAKFDLEVQRKAKEEVAATKSTTEAEANEKANEKEERIQLESKKETEEEKIMQEEANNKVKERERITQDERKQIEAEEQAKADLEVQRKAGEETSAVKSTTEAEANKKEDDGEEIICLESKKEVEEEIILQKESNNKVKDKERMRSKAENISKAATKAVPSSSPIVASTSTFTMTTGVENPHISKSKRTEVTMEAATSIRVASMVSHNGGRQKVSMGKAANDQEVTINRNPSPSQCLPLSSTGIEAITMTTGVAPEMRLAPLLEEETTENVKLTNISQIEVTLAVGATEILDMLPLQVAQNVSTATSITESLSEQPKLQKETNLSTKSAEVPETLLSKETYVVGAPVHTCPST